MRSRARVHLALIVPARDAARSLAQCLGASSVSSRRPDELFVAVVAQTTYHRWRKRHDPAQTDSDRRCRQLEVEVERLKRLKRLVAELLLDKQMLQDVAKKVVTPDQQGAVAGYLAERYKVSQRRAGRVIDRSRSTLRYDRKRRSDDPPLVREIKRLARRHPRFGYRRVHVMLGRKGWSVNLKRVHRLWIELGLKRLTSRKKLGKLGAKPGAVGNICVQKPARFKNDVWT